MNNLSYGFSSGDYYHIINFCSHNNGKFTFANNKKINELNVPFIIYNDIHYNIYMDNNEIPLNVNKAKILTLNNVIKDNHYLKIKIVPGIFDIIIRVFFFIGILIYFVLFFMHIQIKYNKSKKII